MDSVKKTVNRVSINTVVSEWNVGFHSSKKGVFYQRRVPIKV